MTQDLNGKTVLVTGAAGFIGAALSAALLKDGRSVRVIGLDNLNDYYDPSLKQKRLDMLSDPGFVFIHGDITDCVILTRLFMEYHPDIVIHLAAQAGVRYSLINPEAYISTNIVGFHGVLDMCRQYGVQHFVFASSSSVYGDADHYPSMEIDPTDKPRSIYAATKKSDEMIAYAYADMFGIPVTGLRFFTVYGPYGRPDMAYFSFAEKMRKHEEILLFNHGRCERDFTYIDDIVAGVMRVIAGIPAGRVPFALYNMGKGRPDKLMDFVSILKEELMQAGALDADYDLASHIRGVDMQPGDVEITFADNRKLMDDFGYVPETDLRTGLRRFAQWYADYIADSA